MFVIQGGFNCCHIQIEHAENIAQNRKTRKRKWVSEEFHQHEIRTRNSLRSKKPDDDRGQKRRKSIAGVTEYEIHTRSSLSLRDKTIDEIAPKVFSPKGRKSLEGSVSPVESAGYETRSRGSLRDKKIVEMVSDAFAPKERKSSDDSISSVESAGYGKRSRASPKERKSSDDSTSSVESAGYGTRSRGSVQESKSNISSDSSERKAKPRNFRLEAIYGYVEFDSV